MKDEICAVLISSNNIQLNQKFPIGPLNTVAPIGG